MNNLNDFIEENEVLSTRNLIDMYELEELERKLSVKMGPQLKRYITKHGFLAYEHVELFGVNSRQGIKSDMIKISQMLHENFPITKSLIALENRGEGDYILVDENDNVFEFDPNISLEIIGLNKTMLDYIFDRFIQCKNS